MLSKKKCHKNQSDVEIWFIINCIQIQRVYIVIVLKCCYIICNFIEWKKKYLKCFWSRGIEGNPTHRTCNVSPGDDIFFVSYTIKIIIIIYRLL